MIRFLAIAVTIYFTGMAHSEAGDGLKCFASENEKQKHLDDLDKRAQMALMDEDAMPPRAEFSAGPEAFDTRVQQLRSDYAGALSQRRAAADLPLCGKVVPKGKVAEESPPPAPPDATDVGVRPDGENAETVAACIKKLMKERDYLGQNKYGSQEYREAVDLVDEAIKDPVVALKNCEDAPPPAPPESGSSPVGIDCENKALGVVYIPGGEDILKKKLNSISFDPLLAMAGTQALANGVSISVVPPGEDSRVERREADRSSERSTVGFTRGIKTDRTSDVYPLGKTAAGDAINAKCTFMQKVTEQLATTGPSNKESASGTYERLRDHLPQAMKVICNSFRSGSQDEENPWNEGCEVKDRGKGETRIVVGEKDRWTLDITCSIVDENESKTALTPDQLDKVLESFGLKIDDSDMKTCDAVEEGILVVREIKQRLNAAKAEYDNCKDQFYFFTSEEKACARHKQVLDDWRVKYFSAQTKLPVETSALPVETQPSASASE